jgi:hypothetical protein
MYSTCLTLTLGRIPLKSSTVLVAAMIAAIFVRIGQRDSEINDRLSVHFYVIALLSLLSVAGIPSFVCSLFWIIVLILNPSRQLEERAVFLRERKNGLYNSLAYV